MARRPNRLSAATKRAITRRVRRDFALMQIEYQRIARRLQKLTMPMFNPDWCGRLLPLSDHFAAIERTAERAKWRAYELYMWLGHKEIEWQQKAAR